MNAKPQNSQFAQLMLIAALLVVFPKVGWSAIDYAGVRVYGFGANLHYEDVGFGDSDAQLSRSGTATSNGVQEVLTIAKSQKNAARLISLESRASDMDGNAFIGATASAVGSWRDVLLFNGPADPESLTLNFELHGFLHAQGGIGSSAGIRIRVVDRFEFELGAESSFGASSLVSFEGHGAFTAAEEFSNVEWNPLTNEFRGNISFTIPYQESTQSYNWNIAVEAGTFISNPTSGSAQSLFGNTVSLRSVSLEDGTVLDSSQYEFQSGLQINTIPEPSTFALIGFGAALFALRRKRN